MANITLGTSSYTITYNIDTPKIIRVHCNSGLKTCIKEGRLESDAKLMKGMYKGKHGKELGISDRSFAIEIAGHSYASQVLTNVKNNSLVPQNIKDALAKLANSASIADCGESSVDDNRWVWDGIASVMTVGQVIAGIK